MNHQCQAPVAVAQSDIQPTAIPTPEPQSETENSINNCCFLSWNCASNAEWVSGYYAYQANNACTTESQQTYQPSTAHQAELRAAQQPQIASDTADEDDNITENGCSRSQLANLLNAVNQICARTDNERICQHARDSYNKIRDQCGA